MREIKFRYVLRYLDSKEIFFKWYYLNQIEDELNKLFDTRFCELISRDQFTGMHDSTKEEIYENDIIELYGNKSRGVLVEFKNSYVGGWVLTHPSDKERVSLGARIPEEIEIIGNIHQNPELLS